MVGVLSGPIVMSAPTKPKTKGLNQMVRPRVWG